jgi:hypothetical protein
MTIVQQGERERRLEPARDQLGDGLLEEEALAEIALQDVADQMKNCTKIGRSRPSWLRIAPPARNWRCRRR